MYIEVRTLRKILVIGVAGMLGHVVYEYLKTLSKYFMLNPTSQENNSPDIFLLDVRDQCKVEMYLRKVKPDVVINCVGVLIDESARNIEKAIRVNSLFPHHLSRMGFDLNYKLIHISTDCVFSGKAGSYLEDSFQDGSTIYARTKSLGEIVNKKDLTIRTSIIGPELKATGTGLFHWFFHQSGEIEGYENVFWTGVTTLELAKAIDSFIKQDIKGLFHFVPKEKISKYDLLNLFKKIWKKNDITIKPNDKKKSDKSLLNSRNDFKYPMKDYRNMLVELHDWMERNTKYNYYFR